MSDIEERIYAIECKVSELGVLTKRAMDAIQTLEDCQLVRLSPKPYRMTEPTKIGASVISDGTVFTRTDNSDTPWRQHHDLGLAPLRWDWIRSPLPFQNCILTAVDPEPPVGSVVLDCHCGSYERIDGGPLGWRSSRSGYPVGWADIAETPVTLLYRGDA